MELIIIHTSSIGLLCDEYLHSFFPFSDLFVETIELRLSTPTFLFFSLTLCYLYDFYKIFLRAVVKQFAFKKF